ncbi:hypothetical protein CDS [Bradyrhizobium sp.]|nr:hypothetical protein CDS [Bradyrhizobium sp.]
MSPAPAAWAYAGVMNIRTILVETGENRSGPQRRPVRSNSRGL